MEPAQSSPPLPTPALPSTSAQEIEVDSFVRRNARVSNSIRRLPKQYSRPKQFITRTSFNLFPCFLTCQSFAPKTADHGVSCNRSRVSLLACQQNTTRIGDCVTHQHCYQTPGLEAVSTGSSAGRRPTRTANGATHAYSFKKSISA